LSDRVSFRVEGHVAWIRLERPRSLNALDVATDRQLLEAWLEVDRDPEVRVAVLEAAGERAFSAGADVKDLEARQRSPIAIGGGITGLGGPLVELRKPLIAAVQGLALGAGFELALCADIIVAADTASFGMPETKLGLIGDAGVVHRLSRQLPSRVAAGMILGGERLGADRALRFGLVNEVVPPAELHAAAGGWAARIAAVSPLVAQAAKQAMGAGEGRPLKDALARRYELIEQFGHSRDREEAIDAFVSGREPRWQGR
jgi:enoyl-CoA hydratase/carnithine racemase